jgi:hypothetical protein
MPGKTRVTVAGLDREYAAVVRRRGGGSADYEQDVRLVKAHLRKLLLFGRLRRRRRVMAS